MEKLVLTGSRRFRQSSALRLAVCACPLLFALPALADITVGGDAGEVVPTNPASWTSDTTAMIGVNAGKTGTLAIENAGAVSSYDGYIGNDAGSVGYVTVKGAAATWASSWLEVGSYGTGTLAIENGGAVSSDFGYIGNNSGAVGHATVTGAGSTWASSWLEVGSYGTGTLAIENGGSVNSDYAYIGGDLSTNGQVTVTGAGSTWTNSGSLLVAPGAGSLTVINGGVVNTGTVQAATADLKGNGTINTNGLVSDLNLTFDSKHGPRQALSFGTGGVLNLDINGSGDLGVGYVGQATLRIADGVAVTSVDGHLGYDRGSVGQAMVTGAGTTWNTGGLFVGHNGTGTLNIESGGTVSSRTGYCGIGSGSIGQVTVTGVGSTWTNSGDLYVGDAGSGTLNIESGGAVSSRSGLIGFDPGSVGRVTVSGAGSTWTNSGQLQLGASIRSIGILTIDKGGKVTALRLGINDTSSVNLHVSGDDMLVLGNDTTAGRISNGGKVNLFANAFLTPRIYKPISDLKQRTINCTGAGSYNAFGGIWDSGAMTFTVPTSTEVAAGTSDPLIDGERLVITSGGRHVGATFSDVPDGATFAAQLMTSGQLSTLVLDPGESPLSAWSFSPTNLAGSSVLLSFDIGDGASNLQAWHYSNGTWSAFNATDLSYSDGIASFTVDSFSGYAVTGMVPEPTLLGGLAAASLGLLVRKRLPKRR